MRKVFDWKPNVTRPPWLPYNNQKRSTPFMKTFPDLGAKKPSACAENVYASRYLTRFIKSLTTYSTNSALSTYAASSSTARPRAISHPLLRTTWRRSSGPSWMRRDWPSSWPKQSSNRRPSSSQEPRHWSSCGTKPTIFYPSLRRSGASAGATSPIYVRGFAATQDSPVRHLSNLSPPRIALLLLIISWRQ